MSKHIWKWITRILGLAMIAWAGYMYWNDITYTSSFNTYQGAFKSHKEIVVDHWKILIIGCITLFSNEIIRYLNYVKYG